MNTSSPSTFKACLFPILQEDDLLRFLVARSVKKVGQDRVSTVT